MNKINFRNKHISVLLISFTAIFFGIEQGINSIKINSVIPATHFSFENHYITLFFFIGTFLGVIFSSILSYIINRKFCFLSTLAILILVFICKYLIHIDNHYFFYRGMLGFITGSTTFLLPIYLVEINSSARGKNIVLYEIMISVGILTVSIAKYYDFLYIFSNTTLNILILIFLFILCLSMLINSSHWQQIKSKLTVTNKVSYTTILKLFFLGITLQALQQLSGINTVIYYSTKIFISIGFTSSLFDSTAILLVKIFATILVINLIDNIGRKKLLYIGFVFMAISMFFSSILLSNYTFGHSLQLTEKILFLFCILIYIAAYALSIGPIIWLLCVEIFPIRYRNFGVAVTTSTNWLFNAIIVYITFSSINYLNISMLFLYFSIFCILGLIITKYFIPETSKISLIELENNIYNNIRLKDIGNTNVKPDEQLIKFKR